MIRMCSCCVGWRQAGWKNEREYEPYFKALRGVADKYNGVSLIIRIIVVLSRVPHWH